MDDLSDDDAQTVNLFQEPADYYAPDKPATFTEYRCKDDTIIKLRLVGHNPLWGHLLWNAGKVVAAFLETNAVDLVRDKTVLELGAGAGLPSLVCARLGARKVVVTDYPDADLIENLRFNIDQYEAPSHAHNIVAEGYLWGNATNSLRSHLQHPETGFDLLILADILFNHSEHTKLVNTVRDLLKKDQDARALVFFTPYRPWLLQKDLHFFELAKDAGFVTTKLSEHIMDEVMFEADPGDEQMRRTVFGYELRYGQV